MALAEADLRGLANKSSAAQQQSTERPSTPQQEFEGFDPRGTLTRRRAPSSATSSAPRRSPSLSQKSTTLDNGSPGSPSSSVLSYGLLRKSSALRSSQSPPIRQVGFPSPSSSPEISKDEKASPCPTDVRSCFPSAWQASGATQHDAIQGLSRSLAQQTFFPAQEATVTAQSTSSTPVPLEDPPPPRGRRLSRPDHMRSSSESSSLGMSSISRSRSRHPPSLRDQLFDRESRGRNAYPADTAAAPSPMTSYYTETGSDSDSLERGATPWSPAQEFLSGLRKPPSTQDSPGSLMNSVMSIGSSGADKYSQGVEVDGWRIGHFLGAGSFGHVRTCKRLDGPSTSTGYRIGPGQLAAVKVVPLASDAHLTAEIDIWSNLPNHESVLPLLGVYTTDSTNFVFMPLCEGGNLLEYLQNFGESGLSPGVGPVRSSKPRGRRTISSRWSNVSEDAPGSTRGGLPLKLVKHIFTQVVSGIAHLHSKGVTHCDVKLENILLDSKSGRFRLADFGMAQAHTEDLSEEIIAERDGHPASFTEGFTMPPSLEAAMAGRAPTPPLPDSPAGSLEYAAPERLKMTTSSGLKASVDVWALGCVLYALVSGSLPFQDAFEPRLRMKILSGTWEVPKQLVKLSQDRQCDAILKVLQNCLHMDDSQRWTISQVESCEWLTTSWTDEALADSERRTMSSPRRNTSRSQSRGRRALGIDTDAACNSPAEYSPYASEYRQHRSRSRDSPASQRDSSSGSRRRNTNSGPPYGVPMTLSE